MGDSVVHKLSVCPEHGKCIWIFDVVCAKCFQIRKLQDCPEMCSCGERLLPVPARNETPETEWTARICCSMCAKRGEVKILMSLKDLGLERLRV
jgi:hypothetical protein